MRTRLTIMAIVLAAASAAVGMLALLIVLLGSLALAVGVAGAMAVWSSTESWSSPGSTAGAPPTGDGRAMPGDDLLPGAPAHHPGHHHRGSTRGSGRGWSSSATAAPAGTATTGSTTTATQRRPHHPGAAGTHDRRSDPDAARDGPRVREVPPALPGRQ